MNLEIAPDILRKYSLSPWTFLQLIVSLCCGVFMLVAFYLADGRPGPIGGAGKEKRKIPLPRVLE